MDALLDLLGHRIDGSEVALPAIGDSRDAALPTSLLGVLFPVDRNARAVRQCRDIDEPGLLAVGARPVVVAAQMRWADLFKPLIGIEVSHPGIDLDVLARVVVEGLAGLLVDTAGPVHIRVWLG